VNDESTTERNFISPCFAASLVGESQVWNLVKHRSGRINMALSQMQIIQSLGEAMNWLEREIGWGVDSAELRHLMGRIGELYVAMITNGQMAPNTNEKGYDVVTRIGQRISVKTTTMTNGSGSVSFNLNTLKYVDRIIILQFNATELEIEILLDALIDDAKALMTESEVNGKRSISLSKLMPKKKSHTTGTKVSEAAYKEYRIIELESGTIEVYTNNLLESKSKPVLTKIAQELNVSILNSNGNLHNTRTLGSHVIKTINAEMEAVTAENQNGIV
jgi:hypothetical protein